MLDIDGIVTHSTDITHAPTLAIVVSEACHSSTVQQDTAFDVQILIVPKPLAIDHAANAPTVTKLAQVVILACVACVVAVSGASPVIVATVSACHVNGQVNPVAVNIPVPALYVIPASVLGSSVHVSDSRSQT